MIAMVGFAAALGLVVALGAGVVVLKETVDNDRDYLRSLRLQLIESRAETQRLRAEYAFHQRPDYLKSYAGALGLVPLEAARQRAAVGLMDRPDGEGDATFVGLIALPSGELVALRRRALDPAPILADVEAVAGLGPVPAAPGPVIATELPGGVAPATVGGEAQAVPSILPTTVNPTTPDRSSPEGAIATALGALNGNAPGDGDGVAGFGNALAGRQEAPR